MKGITYCTNESCPFKMCEKHYSHLYKLRKEGWLFARTANLGGTCREYIDYLVRILERDRKREERGE